MYELDYSFIEHRAQNAMEAIEANTRQQIQEKYNKVDIETLYEAHKDLVFILEKQISRLKQKQERVNKSLKAYKTAKNKWTKFLPQLEALLQEHNIDIPISIQNKHLNGNSMIEKLNNLEPSGSIIIDGNIFPRKLNQSELDNPKEDIFITQTKLTELQSLIDKKVEIYHKLLGN
ncbi:hypothetical protein [Sulfurimonas marina]|uniref:Uncharacterized protein n=1 Tax=Sulfurimonas marina TaxID=2590551 RepID=A0A7M1AUF4_9BACT|nr:hypothetical protein [Sulfurimonas marina]QOP41053.1 hypothetical protein FJR03_04580 [Sulfurimonas marina]